MQCYETDLVPQKQVSRMPDEETYRYVVDFVSARQGIRREKGEIHAWIALETAK